ncbi:MAG: NAD(P)H-dependent oxidoreductase [Chloroflexi bacterium]|nr:NAD(P)H-dependent oxidoreductase [Chloroflexota bacterium]
MKILAFAASSSRKSINKALVAYAANLLKAEIIKNAEVEIIDMNDFETALYSIDREKESGIPERVQKFYKKIGAADALLISYAEHNGYYTAVFKNLLDWTSRIDRKIYQGKPAVLLSTSPGSRGARRVLEVAKKTASSLGMDMKADLSVPHFNDNFDRAAGKITNTNIKATLNAALATLIKS